MHKFSDIQSQCFQGIHGFLYRGIYGRVLNFGYAYLRHHDPEAAEPWLLLALVLAPGRVNAWVNLGQAYAKQGQRSKAVACLANGYRFSKNQAATRQFLHKLAEDEDDEVREAARQTLQLPLVQAGKD